MSVSANILIEVEQELSTGVGLPPRDVHVLVGRWSRITIRKALRELVRQGRVNSAVRTCAVIGLSLCLLACAQRKTIDGVTYDTYGLLSADEKRNPDIQYEIVWGNVFWSIVLFETAIAPIYFFGFSIFEPVAKKSAIKGQVAP